jgi:hypothetical protein
VPGLSGGFLRQDTRRRFGDFAGTYATGADFCFAGAAVQNYFYILQIGQPFCTRVAFGMRDFISRNNLFSADRAFVTHLPDLIFQNVSLQRGRKIYHNPG